MRRRVIWGLMLAANLAAGGYGASADQSDPRLLTLFERLQAGEPAQARSAEKAIWSIWLETEDRDVEALMSLALGHMGEGELEEAIGVLDAAITRAPGFAEAWNKRATAHFLNRNYAASVSDIYRTLELEPRHFGAISGLGLIFLQRNDLPAALEAFERVLVIYPHARGAQSHVKHIKRRLIGRSV
tara:strand:+ start:512 stop:1069 length:558 start_codon:yes stop_codon:yes gene_type:complete